MKIIKDETSLREKLIAKLFINQNDPQFTDLPSFYKKGAIFEDRSGLFDLIIEKNLVEQLDLAFSQVKNSDPIWLIAFRMSRDNWNYWIYALSEKDGSERKLLGEIKDLKSSVFEGTWTRDKEPYDAFLSRALPTLGIVPPMIAIDQMSRKIIHLKHRGIVEYDVRGKIVSELTLSEETRPIFNDVTSSDCEEPFYKVMFSGASKRSKMLILFCRDVPVRVISYKNKDRDIEIRSARGNDTNQTSRFYTSADSKNLIIHKEVFVFYASDIIMVYQRTLDTERHETYNLVLEYRPINLSYGFKQKKRIKFGPHLFAEKVSVRENKQVYFVEVLLSHYGNKKGKERTKISLPVFKKTVFM